MVGLRRRPDALGLALLGRHPRPFHGEVAISRPMATTLQRGGAPPQGVLESPHGD